MGTKIDNILKQIAWDKSPLIPTITQDLATKQILMLAYSNKESLCLTLQKGIAHYFSRSKNRIWQKGEESGNIQKISEIYIDCDNDAILFLVNQKGFACHTGNFSCFFKQIDWESLSIKSDSSVDSTQDVANIERKSPYHIIDLLYHILQERKFESAENSYTAKLYAKGENAICKKIVEEAGEVTFAIKDYLRESKNYPTLAEGDKGGGCKPPKSNIPQTHTESVIYESADLIYHLLVGLSYCDISPDKVISELKRRFGISGITEKNARKDK